MLVSGPRCLLHCSNCLETSHGSPESEQVLQVWLRDLQQRPWCPIWAAHYSLTSWLVVDLPGQDLTPRRPSCQSEGWVKEQVLSPHDVNFSSDGRELNRWTSLKLTCPTKMLPFPPPLQMRQNVCDQHFMAITFHLRQLIWWGSFSAGRPYSSSEVAFASLGHWRMFPGWRRR